MRKLVVKDVRQIAKYLAKTGLKKTLLDIMFPKNEDNNLPKTWVDLRKHLQETYAMSDHEFFEYREACQGSLETATAKYRSDFPAFTFDLGNKVIEVVMEILEDDMKYEETVILLANLFEVERSVFEDMSIAELIETVQGLFKDTDFLASAQSLTPQTEA